MRDHTKLRAFELADEAVVLIYRVPPNVLGALIRSMRIPNGLQPKQPLSSYAKTQ